MQDEINNGLGIHRQLVQVQVQLVSTDKRQFFNTLSLLFRALMTCLQQTWNIVEVEVEVDSRFEFKVIRIETNKSNISCKL